MNTNFSLDEFWSQGDQISNFVAVILIAMSVLTWTIILMKAIGLARQKKFAKRVEAFWHSSSFSAGLKALGNRPDNVFYLLAHDGVEAVQHLERPTTSSERQLHDQLDLSDWVTRALRNSAQSSLAKLQAGLTFLASI
jgi:biopolymer transport protein ExbB